MFAPRGRRIEDCGLGRGIAWLRNWFFEILKRKPIGILDESQAAESVLMAKVGKTLDCLHHQHVQRFQLVQ